MSLCAAVPPPQWL